MPPWYAVPAVAYLFAVACMLGLGWRLADLVWGFWIASFALFHALMLVFLVAGYSRGRLGIAADGASHWVAFPRYVLFMAFMAIPVVGVPHAVFSVSAEVLQRYVPLTGGAPRGYGAMAWDAFLLYWPLILTVAASQWRTLALRRMSSMRELYVAGVALAMVFAVGALAVALALASWLLRGTDATLAESALGCVVLAFACAPLDDALEWWMRRERPGAVPEPGPDYPR